MTFVVFRQAESRTYVAPVVSKATFVYIFCLALAFLPGFLILDGAKGVWLQVNDYQELPNVVFKYKILLVVDTTIDGGYSYVAWSTYQNFNQLQMERLRVPLVKAKEEDEDYDGRNDKLSLQIDVPLLDTEEVHGFNLLLFFDYRLYSHSKFRMESMAHLEYASPGAGSSYEYTGNLKLQQTMPLSTKGKDRRYEESLVDGDSIYAEEYDFAAIFKKYVERNVTSVLADGYQTWKATRGADDPFVIKANIYYPEANVLYTPGFWEEIRHGWIIYFSITVLFLVLSLRVRSFVFQYQLVPTIMQRPWHSKGICPDR